MRTLVLVGLVLVVVPGCSRTGLFRSPPPELNAYDTPPPLGDIEIDLPAEPDVAPDVDAGPLVCPEDEVVPGECTPQMDSERVLGFCDGLDNDCDGQIDEGCPCEIGDVQSCFGGPPGRDEVGACRRGTQRCATLDDDVLGWGACNNSVEPSEETCDDTDNDCDGCTDEFVECEPEGSCPTVGDPRVLDGLPLVPYELNGRDFYFGEAVSWRWEVEGGICDALGSLAPSFELTGSDSEVAQFLPRLSGAYRVSLTVETPDGPFECSWIVDVFGPGLRVEMCYPESTQSDLDLYMMPSAGRPDWFVEQPSGPGGRSFLPNNLSCGWQNCEARIRGTGERADWGYENSPIEYCEGGPQGDQWRELGFCANPRLDIDNNLQEGTGLPENINVDAPRDGDRFRVMVQNWSGSLAHPVVNVYCAGRLTATFGAAPDELEGFDYLGIQFEPNAMWRAADILMEVDATGQTTGCTVTAPRRADGQPGYDVTFNEERF